MYSMPPIPAAVEIERIGGRLLVRSIAAGGIIRMHGFDLWVDAETFAESERVRLEVTKVVRR